MNKYVKISTIAPLLVITAVALGMSKKAPVQVVEATPAPVATPAPTVTPTPVASTASLDSIRTIAANSACAKYCFKDGKGCGPMNKSYLRGVALTYAKAVCQPKRGDVIVASQAVGAASKDVLALYAPEFKALKMTNANADEILRHIYTLLIGSAMRESSGRWCVGKDPGASNVASSECEAGLYQTSYNSHIADPELSILYAFYKTNKSGCFAADYQKGISCDAANMKNWGTGEGVTFQALEKSCPAFATEYAAIMFRVNRAHYGPLNRKTVELRPECDDMYTQVKKYVTANPTVCDLF